jgi:DNA-binding CsgD family transcriptional regulator
MVELAAPMLTLGGAAVLWNRRRRGTVEAEGNAAAGVVGLRREEVREDGPRRTIYVYAKVAATPPGFPRPGTAAFDDPLGAAIDPGDWVPDGGAVRLTPLEQRVLELLADDRRDFEIAGELDLPLRYAREQVRRVRRKLAAKTIEETVARARGCGLLSAEGASVAP